MPKKLHKKLCSVQPRNHFLFAFGTNSDIVHVEAYHGRIKILLSDRQKTLFQLPVQTQRGRLAPRALLHT